jgi:hypothetical protein
MKKYFFFIFFIFNESWSIENKPIDVIKGCNYKIEKNYLNKIDNLPIKLIEVDFHDYRKWTINSVRILTNRYRYVPERFKKRFDATITVVYGNNSKCVLKGKIRHSGDEKDHISKQGNSISQSLDIHLSEGNIRGITKFKLLRPNTRGVLNDEILITQILRNLNFIAPRSIKVETRVNKTLSTMLFQEKAAKEMLEFNSRREAPILEADERFFFKAVSKIEDNQRSGWDMGVVQLMNKSSQYMLSKQINSHLLTKSDGHKKMSFDAVNNLNLIYLYFSNRFQDNLNNYNYFDYDLDNTLLGSFDEVKIKKLDEYNLFMQATNSVHGLAANNRKFYWNSIENYFEPINYDSNANIDKNLSDTSYRYPFSASLDKSFKNLRYKINNLNQISLLENLNFSGIKFTKKDLETKISKIIYNLDQLEYNYFNKTTNQLIKHNETKITANILNNFHKNLKEQHPNTYLIKQDNENNNFQKCKIFLENCYEIALSSTDASKLIEGDLQKDNSFIQFLGNNFDLNNLLKYKNYNKSEFKNVDIYYENGVNFNLDEKNNTINIKQNKAGAKFFFINGTLKDTIINFQGHILKNNNSNTNELEGYPVNHTGLTGCLSLINLTTKNIKIKANNSTCEDAVNFVNTNGNVDLIKISNSYSDALDVDFSNLTIKNIQINSAINDCVDFSYGNYNLDNLSLSGCGDKALSVGEKSLLSLNKIHVSGASTGVASKDSSIVKIYDGIFNSASTCLSAYKKKQEFEGGIIEIVKFKCDFKKDKTNFDKYSFIDFTDRL